MIGGSAKVTTYINEFVYQGDVLQYINFEEGRIRPLTAVSTNNGYDGLAIDGNMDLPGGKRGAYDYVIRDYQQNVRIILTEETHYGINQCTMEAGRSGNEEPFFGQDGGSNEVVSTRFTKPAGWASNTSNSVSKLSKLTGHTMGPNSLLKVMAGDVFNATTDYYYPAAVTNNHNSLVTDIVGALIQTITGSSAVTPLVHGSTTNISSSLNASVPFANIADPNKAATDNIPRAYLNVMFFDERFNFVEEGSMALRVSQPGDGADPLVLNGLKAPKNGYVYIYVSNENDDAVYFDNFTVSDTRGRIIEEDHYYAFGLKIAGISSVKMGDMNEGSLKNNNLYNDKELFDDADLNWYDYGFRNYDAQIGRFPQLDPLTDDYPELTNYQYASNEPIANVDMDGLEKIGVTTPGGIWNGSFLTPLASKSGAQIGEKIIQTAFKVGTSIANREFADNVIKKALEGGVEKGGSTLLKGSGLLIYLTLKPEGTGKELTPRQLYERLGYPKFQPSPSPKFDPPTDKPRDERIHEQYVLEAAEEGDFDVMIRGYKAAQGKIHLKVGEVWKYGTTVNPEKRYTQKWLREKKLLKFRQDEGTRPEVLAKEKEKIKEYLLKNGKLPPGNKQTN